jgi:CBS domain-containing protein
MKSDLTVKDVMTPCPVSIRADGSIEEARRLMALHSLRHLPVTDAGEVMGLVSARDLDVSDLICKAFGQCPRDIRSMEPKVPVVVEEDLPLVALAQQLATTKAECVLVADSSGNFTGIFTTSDAFRVLYLLLQEVDPISSALP